MKCVQVAFSTHTQMLRSVFLKIRSSRNFPGHPMVKTSLPTQRARVRSLIGELRSHVLQGVAKNKGALQKHLLFFHYGYRGRSQLFFTFLPILLEIKLLKSRKNGSWHSVPRDCAQRWGPWPSGPWQATPKGQLSTAMGMQKPGAVPAETPFQETLKMLLSCKFFHFLQVGN